MLKIAQLQSTFSSILFILLGAMESDKTTQITAEVIRLTDLQVEALKGTLAEMTVSQAQEYAERRDRIGQLCLELG